MGMNMPLVIQNISSRERTNNELNIYEKIVWGTGVEVY